MDRYWFLPLPLPPVVRMPGWLGGLVGAGNWEAQEGGEEKRDFRSQPHSLTSRYSQKKIMVKLTVSKVRGMGQPLTLFDHGKSRDLTVKWEGRGGGPILTVSLTVKMHLVVNTFSFNSILQCLSSAWKSVRRMGIGHIH